MEQPNPLVVNAATQAVVYNEVKPLRALSKESGVQLATAANAFGVLDGYQYIGTINPQTSLDSALRRAGGSVDTRLIQVGGTSALTTITGCALRFTVLNNDPAADTILVPAQFLIERIEVNIGGSVEIIDPETLWFAQRGEQADRIANLETMCGYSHSKLPGYEQPTSSSATVANIRKREFSFSTGATDIFPGQGGNAARFLASTATDTNSIFPGQGATSAAVAGLRQYSANNAVHAGFIPRGGSKTYILPLPQNGLWSGFMNLLTATTDVILKVYFRFGSAVFDTQARQTYNVSTNVQVHANSAQLQLTSFEVLVEGMVLEGAPKAEFMKRHLTNEIQANSISVKQQSFLFPIPVSSTFKNTFVLGSLSSVYRSVLFFVRPAVLQGSEELYQVKKAYNVDGQLTDILDRRAFAMDNVTMRDRYGNVIWAQGLDSDTMREYEQYIGFSTNSPFNHAMCYVEFQMSGLPQGDEHDGARFGGFKRISSEQTIEFTLPNIGLYTAAPFNGTGQLELVCLPFAYSAYRQLPNGTIVKKDYGM